MLQAIVRKGGVIAEEVPAPSGGAGLVTIRVSNSCISAGTELNSVGQSGRSVVSKVLENPEKLMRAAKSAQSMGLSAYMANLRGSALAGEPVGYSVAGEVVGVGEGVTDFAVGDMVAAGGAAHAHHAEYVAVPTNLTVKIPEGLDARYASTVTPGAIALHGVRRADLRVGEICVVFGTGLLGLLATQLLRASGIRVICVDLSAPRLQVARDVGAEATVDASQEDAVTMVMQLTGDHGADAVLFAADAQTSEPLSLAFQMCRKKGRVVMLGKADMTVRRGDVYPRELDLLTSTSYGPGRYDRAYEEKGLEYPYAYVRWTERRNMEEYLRLVAKGQVRLDPLLGGEFHIGEVDRAFAALRGEARPILLLLNYRRGEAESGSGLAAPERRVVLRRSVPPAQGVVRMALVGPGAFARAVHLPILKSLQQCYAIQAVVARTGHRARAIAQQYDASYCATDIGEVLQDAEVDLVAITTGHDSHASLVLRSLRAGKNVFVEKPLCTTEAELDAIADYFDHAGPDAPLLMVGYNRRFSGFARAIKKATDERLNPLFVHYRMNAGRKNTNDPIFEHGGRIVGEACHIVDLMTFLTGSPIESIGYESIRPKTDWLRTDDNRSMVLRYQDGSVCTIQYVALGHSELEKEYMEVHFDGKSIIMRDFQELKGFGVRLRQSGTGDSSKGHRQEWEALHQALTRPEGTWPIELWDLLQTSRTTLRVV